MGTGTNKPNRHNMATGTNTPESAVMQTQTNKASVSNMETQTNNNNGRNIPNMTEDQLLQQYTSVYETISSKADAEESVALFKKHLQMIKNPFAIYMAAHVATDNNNMVRNKSATLYIAIITRNEVHVFHSNYFSMPIHYTDGYATGPGKNTIRDPYIHKFKKPLDGRLVRMFQSISKRPVIGNQNTTVINMPGCQPCTTGGNIMGAAIGVFQDLFMAL